MEVSRFGTRDAKLKVYQNLKENIKENITKTRDRDKEDSRRLWTGKIEE